MSRSGYNDDFTEWQFIRWRGAVKQAIRGQRGQALLKEMLAVFDSMPEKKLISHEFEQDGNVCALGAVGRARGLDLSKIDPEDREATADAFGIAGALAAEIMYENDEMPYWSGELPEVRFQRMRTWVASQIAA